MTTTQDVHIKTFGPPLTETPIVSVKMITYNHERYIHQAIESVFAQDFDSPMELVIGEDCSTDNTRAIIEAICRNAPIHVRLLTSERNVGMHVNSRRVLNECKGRYVALLEGDDYWIDKTKLREQVAIISEHPELQAIAHRARLEFDSDVPPEVRLSWGYGCIPDLPPGLIDAEVLLHFRHMIPTASLLVQRSLLNDWPKWVDTLPMLDCFITLKAALSGGIVLLKDCWSVYRVTSGGALASAGYFGARAGQVELVRQMLRHSRGEDAKLLKSALRNNAYSLAHAQESVGNSGGALMTLRRLAAAELANGVISARTLRWMTRLRFPRAWTLAARVFRGRDARLARKH